MLAEIDGAVNETFALELAERVGKFDLASVVILVVEVAARQATAADEAFGEGVGLVARVPEELAGIAIHVFIGQHGRGIAKRRILLARIDAEARLADTLPITGADLESGLQHRGQGNGVGIRHLEGFCARGGATAGKSGRARRENQALAHGTSASRLRLNEPFAQRYSASWMVKAGLKSVPY